MLSEIAISIAAPTSREASFTAEATPCFSAGVPLMIAAVGAVHRPRPVLRISSGQSASR